MIEVTFVLPERSVRDMKDLAVLKQMNEAKVLAQALNYYKLVTTEQLNGSKIVIEKPDGTFRIIEEQ